MSIAPQTRPNPEYCPECCRAVAAELAQCPHCANARPERGWPRDLLIGELVGGKYRLLARLGAGSFGIVYLACHEAFQANRAIKVLHERLAYDAKVVERFQREAKAIYRLNARHIVRLEDFGELRPGLPYMALEYAEGPSLGEIIKKSGRLSHRRALRLARQIALALADAAKANVLHRDLKPQNILVDTHELRGDEIKVLDFGIAKILGEEAVSLTDSKILGSPSYMAPEQWASTADVDARADLFSLGVLLFEMLTGRLPWPPRQGDPFSILAQIQTQPAPRLSEVVSDWHLPDGLEELVGELLARDPARRPQTARDVIARIDALKLLSTATFDLDGIEDSTQPDPPGSAAAEAAAREARTEAGPSRQRFWAPTTDMPSDVEARRAETISAGPAAVRSRTSRGLVMLGAVLGLVAAGLAAFQILDQSGGTGADPDASVDTADAAAAMDAGDADGSGEQVTADVAEGDLAGGTADRTGMVRVSGGAYPLGQSDDDLARQIALWGDAAASYRFEARRTAILPAFWIDRQEVPIAALEAFRANRTAEEAALLRERCAELPGRDFGSANPLEPARGVSFAEADAFCRARGARLPTFEEWEAAARGPRGQTFPWGDDLDRIGASNHGRSDGPPYALAADIGDGFLGPAPVTALGAGASHCGAEAMAGNVSEWVTGPNGQDQNPPYFHRGGGFLGHPLFSQGFAHQFVGDACTGYPQIGFRCAVEDR